MNILSSIFGSENVISNGMKAIDMMVFTDEEKVDAKLKLLKQYEPFKLAQRLLALLYSFVFLSVYLLSVSLWVYGGLFIDSVHVMELAKELALWNTTTLGAIIMLVIGFYFAGGVMDWKRGS